MMTLSKQRKFTFNSLLEDIRGSQCCVIKVRQYTNPYHRRLGKMDWRSVENAKVIRADIKTHALLSRSSKDIMLTYVLFMVVIQCPFPQFADWLGKYSEDVGPVIGYHKSDISKYACSPKIVEFFLN